MGVKKVSDHIQYFNTLVEQNTLSHAYLLTGDGHDDKKYVIQKIVQSLIKQHDLSDEEKARLTDNVSEGQFADLLFIEPEGQGIRIDQMRQLKEWLSTSPMELGFKVAVIESADKMNVSSSNSLLKMLEEPQGRVYLFLLTSEATAILPTIRSRVQQVHFFETVDEKRLTDLKEQYELDGTHAELILLFPNQMQQELLKDYDVETFERFLKVFNYFYKLLFMKDSYGFIAVHTHLKEFLSKTGAIEGLEYLLLLNHSVLMHLIEVNEPPQFQSYWIKEWLPQVKATPKRCIDIHEYLINVKERLKFNVAAPLAYEQLVIRCLEN